VLGKIKSGKITRHTVPHKKCTFQLLPCSYSSTCVVTVLLSLCSQIGRTALMWASWAGHTDAARILLSAGAKVDLQDMVRYSICVLQTP